MAVGYREKDDRYTVTCDKNSACCLSIAVNTAEAAQQLYDQHQCPTINGKSKYAWSVTVTLVEQMWEKVDQTYAQLAMAPAVGPDLERLRGAVRMACEMIAIFMPPYFRTSDEVGREVMKRYEKKQASEEYETAGVGSRTYELANSRKAPVRITAPPTRKPLTAIPERLDADDIRMIKFMGREQIAQIAETFGITLDEADAVLSS